MRRTEDFPLVIHLWNILSLDIVLGAVSISWAVASRLGIAAETTDYLLLGCAAWAIFTFDHLIDAWKIPKPAGTLRHRFHQQYFIPILCFFLLDLLAIMVLLFFVDLRKFLDIGLLAAGVVTLYFLLYYVYKRAGRPFPLKEIFIALGFTLGCLSIASVVMKSGTQDEKIAWCWFAGYVFLTAINNVLLLAYFERNSNKEERDYSIAGIVGPASVKWINGLIFLLALGILNYINFGMRIPYHFNGLILINCCYLCMMLKPSWFEQKERYRVFVDGALALPVLLWITSVFKIILSTFNI